MRPAASFILMVLLAGFWQNARAQLQDYRYFRKLIGVERTWHTVELPAEMFGHLNQRLTDLRVFGLADSGDTLEAPWVLRVLEDEVQEKEVPVRILNRTRKGNRYLFTLEMPGLPTLNHLQPDFAEENFSWRASLEGSTDFEQWYPVTSEQRLVSIQNDFTSYRYTSLHFEPVKYRYLRLSIEGAKQQPELQQVKIWQRRVKEGLYHTWLPDSVGVSQNTEYKETLLDIDLGQAVPVSYLQINVLDSFDYVRPVVIQYLSDSVQTGKGWRLVWNTLTSGNLSSLEEAGDFAFPNTVTSRLRVIVQNFDNEPLQLGKVTVKGNVHELLARFRPEEAGYVLAYGNPGARAPRYDLQQFTDRLPEDATSLVLGEQQSLQALQKTSFSPSKLWLWVIIAGIMLTLAGFTLKMMRNAGG